MSADVRNTLTAMAPEEAAFALAIAVIVDRLQRLDGPDREDMYTLVSELSKASTQEERDEVVQTMKEILDGSSSSVRVRRHEFARNEHPERLTKWVLFVGSKVKHARDACNLTQVQLAEQTGLPQSHISRIENGRLSPSRVTLEKLAPVLGLKVEDFD